MYLNKVFLVSGGLSLLLWKIVLILRPSPYSKDPMSTVGKPQKEMDSFFLIFVFNVSKFHKIYPLFQNSKCSKRHNSASIPHRLEGGHCLKHLVNNKNHSANNPRFVITQTKVLVYSQQPKEKVPGKGNHSCE